MIDVGHFSLAAAWFLSLYGLIGGSIAAWKRKESFIESARNSIVLVSFFTLLSLVALAALFLSHDYRYSYVWRTSNNEMSPLYLVSAIWGGMDGSMLLWAGIMSIYGLFIVKNHARFPQLLFRWFVPVFSGAINFFLTVVLFLTNPFRLLPLQTIPTDGNGLNPLLQNPSMLIHPPMLYAGFTGLSIPFSFCIAALLGGYLSNNWIELTRRATLIAWGFLTVGIILGGNWAYIELGWGGFWAWDPVENASFLPWLSATAFLHSAMVQTRRGSLKVWTISLCALSYILTVFGTFLTRSGVVQSVHAFAETDVGWVFLVYIGILFFLTVLLIALRFERLKPESKIETFLSREAAFLFNNLLLLGVCFATIWGVLFPIISEAVTGEKSVVGPPFFNQVNVPLFLLLLFLMGVGPLLAWKRSSGKALLKNFIRPFLGGSAITILFLFIDSARVYAATSFGLCVFVLIAIGSEFHRGVKLRKELTAENSAQGFVNLLRRKPRQYGAHIIHFGVAVMTISITASMAYKIEKDFTLRIGESYEVGRFKLTLEDIFEQKHSNYTALKTVVRVNEKKSGNRLGELLPEKRFYPKGEESTTEVDIQMSPREDLYLALAGLNIDTPEQTDYRQNEAVFKVFVNPLQIWLWIGAFFVAVGTIVVISPRALQQPALSRERSPAEVEA